MNQVERRNAIKEILFSDRNAQIQNLADRFGVSVRTIKYDIEALTCSSMCMSTQTRAIERRRNTRCTGSCTMNPIRR